MVSENQLFDDTFSNTFKNFHYAVRVLSLQVARWCRLISFQIERNVSRIRFNKETRVVYVTKE